MKTVINQILTFMWPHRDPIGRPSVFIQESWLEKIMRPTQVKDYLWTPSKLDLPR